MLLRKLFQLLLVSIRIVRQQNNERFELLVFVFSSSFVKLPDQTGQVVRNRSRENRDDRTLSVKSSVAE